MGSVRIDRMYDSRPDYHGLPTPRSTLRSDDSGAQVLVWCQACQHQAEADLEKLVAEGRGDVPLIQGRPHPSTLPRSSACRARWGRPICQAIEYARSSVYRLLSPG